MLYLEVPFKEKDQAKALGARWDRVNRKWYLPNPEQQDLSLFQRWLPSQDLLQLDSGSGSGFAPDAGFSVSSASADQLEQSAVDQFLHSADLFQPTTPQVGAHNSAQQTPNFKAETKPEPKSATKTSEEKGIKLSQFLTKIQTVIETNFRQASWVFAEIGNLNERRGHYYFDLTENDSAGRSIASSRAMLWASKASKLLQNFKQQTGSDLQIGQQVLLQVSVNYNPKYGLSLVIEDIDPKHTLGALEANLIKIRETLIKEGVYQQNKQLKVPADIFKVAVISPPNAAGLGDFQAEADKLVNLKLCEFSYFYSSFQGDRVLPEMQTAFQQFLTKHQAQEFDLLVIIRGGGSKLDLHPLNQYEIAKAITQSPVPVFTGIGHERDSAILDEVAHTKFDTPSKVIHGITSIITQAGLVALGNWQQIEKQTNWIVQNQQAQLAQLKQLLDLHQQSVASFWRNLIEQLSSQVKMRAQAQILTEAGQLNALLKQIQQQVKTPLIIQNQQLNDSFAVIKTQASKVIQQQKHNLEQNYLLIVSSGPKVQLKRGFSIAKTEQNQVIGSAEQAKQQAKLRLEFHDGEVLVTPIKN